MVEVVTVDDHQIYLKGLNLLLAEAGFKVVGSANTGAGLLELLTITQPDVLLLDMQLPDCDTEELIQQIRKLYPDLKILYNTMMRGTRFIHKLMQYQIQGYILKNAELQQLTEALHMIAAGGSWYSREIDISNSNDDAYKSTVTVPSHKVHEILTSRELEVLKLICKEYSNSEIAALLFLSVGTIDTHRKNIIQKIGVNNTVGLVKFALQNKLVNNE